MTSLINPLVSVHNLCKSYDELPILKGVNLVMEKGDLVSIIGPSGCGKSTFLRCLNGLENFDSGDVMIAGVSLHRQFGEKISHRLVEQQSHELRQRVGMVFQQFNLFPNRTILDNVSLAPQVVKGISKSEAQDRAQIMLEKVGLGHFSKRYPSQMSGGQQQRAAIARALAMSPQVMLYDEPTSSLDPQLVDEVLAVMKALDNEGMTQIVVTHEILFAKEASDYIVYMEGGEIIEISDEDEIFINPQDQRTRNFLRRFM
ncbi:MAG: glutamine ABC transporter ATP-binding protein [Verrucomicrobia bacterium RIFCSPHIGHO2_12_FULL_41_10]|nr:MAG: glutamine ABC transporter ATP-binding protein [Verrucomicrobia bacterium RIFCSPHIGHO2_12_FULL_41_10]HLB33280.1 amino acid ABC transporter ATP-binding protein [Chthoniobacterales bacterium]